MYKLHKVCRSCGLGAAQLPTLKESLAAGTSQDPKVLLPVFDLGLQPLANDFCNDSQERAGYAPLKVLYCPRCTLAQLSVVVRSELLYRNYNYVTSPSQTMQDHFQQLAEVIKAEVPGRSLLEIGSNDGALLESFKARGFTDCLGVDPAENLCRIAEGKGIKTVCNFFTRQVARELAAIMMPDVILARHVFCHVDDWADFVQGLEELSSRETLICIEVPYLLDLLTRGEFDTIYHEHLSMLSVRAMVTLLKDTGLRLNRIVRFLIHGGAILLMLRSAGSTAPLHSSVHEYLDFEDDKVNLDAWKKFEIGARTQIQNLRSQVAGLCEKGKRVAGLGASAKSTVWLNACGFTRRQISWIADTTAQKQYKFCPGTDIPVTDEGAILRDLPDYLILFSWNYAEEIIRKQRRYLELGGQIIIPIPSLRIVDKVRTREF